MNPAFSEEYFRRLVEIDLVVLKASLKRMPVPEEIAKPEISHREQRLVQGWTEFESTNVAFCRYTETPDMLRGNLEVEFKDGSVYKYHDVPDTLVVEFAKSESPGKFVRAKLVGKFRTEKLSAGTKL